MKRTLRGDDEAETLEGRNHIYEICHSIAERTGADIRSLPPVYETVDPDALTAFLRSPNSLETQPERSVEFSYCGYRVRVDSTGQITLYPESESPDSRPSIGG